MDQAEPIFSSTQQLQIMGHTHYTWNNNNKKKVNGAFSPLRKCLTSPIPIPNEVKKLTWVFIFVLPSGASKGFMTALKAFIKPFDAPQRSVNIKT